MSASRKKGILRQARTWVSLEDLALSDISQTQKDKHGDPTSVRSLDRQGHRDRSWKVDCRRGNGACLMDEEFQFCEMKEFLRLIVQVCCS